MIQYKYDRHKGEMITPCPFGQRVMGVLTRVYGQGDIVMVGSNACVGCPNYCTDTMLGVTCKLENV